MDQLDVALTSIEICAGAGGQALGLEWAGFSHEGLVELDPWACRTLKRNRPAWPVWEGDVRRYRPPEVEGLALLAGGVPCPPFSYAGKQLGADDERDLFPAALDLVATSKPRAVMLENVRGLLDPVFEGYRQQVLERLDAMGYTGEWRLLNASDYGVPQLRPRAVLVALQKDIARGFSWPEPTGLQRTVGQALYAEMASKGWAGVDAWAARANAVAPTLVGGSHKHGGPDLGPTRAKKAWAAMGVNALKLGDAPPGPDFDGDPLLTVRMTAILQGFPPDWLIEGGKTAAYRQVGNAFPPPVAAAVGRSIRRALEAAGAVPLRVDNQSVSDAA